MRSKVYPYGFVQMQSVEDNTLLANRALGSCELKHHLGDYFSLEYPQGSLITSLTSYLSLRATPGVFVLSFDNCAEGFDEEYRKTTMLITNCLKTPLK